VADENFFVRKIITIPNDTSHEYSRVKSREYRNVPMEDIMGYQGIINVM
jgi:hypothetical protein